MPDTSKLEKLNRELEKSEKKLRKAINDESTMLDLVSPSSGAINVFTTILPFPYGDKVQNQTNIAFDLSAAQGPILFFKGTHTFKMVVIDNTGCRNEIPVVLVVE